MKFGNKIAVYALAAMIFAVGAVQSVVAQEATESHLTAAKRAITATRSTDRLDIILPQMAEEAKAELIRNRPDEEAQLTVLVDEAALTFASRRGDLENEVAQVFAKVFSEAELVSIADFYESEAGKKFLAESPIVVREMTEASRIWAGGVQRDLQALIQEKLKEKGLQ